MPKKKSQKVTLNSVLKKKIDKLLQTGFNNEVFAAAEVLVAQHGEVVAHAKVGQVYKASRFDLSSLTKPLVVSSLFLQLAAKRVVTLDQPVSDFLRTKTLKKITIQDLLEHRSGLVAWASFLPRQLQAKRTSFANNKKKILYDILHNEKYIIGKKQGETVYSDLGYIVLGAILEKITRKKLLLQFRKMIKQPLGLNQTLAYQPLSHKTLPIQSHMVPSGICRVRQRLLQGEVQDDNAYVMGGVSGHAGLFGNALAIHQILQQWRLAKTKESVIFPKASFQILNKGLKVPLKNRHRFICGFDTVDAKSPNFGTGFNRRATLCHLGYSGVSFAWDLSKDLWVILLTNRGMFGADNPKIYDFRTNLHNMVLQEF